jgi:hypothetical protein
MLRFWAIIFSIKNKFAGFVQKPCKSYRISGLVNFSFKKQKPCRFDRANSGNHSNQILLAGINSSLGAVTQAQAVEDVRHVIFDRAFADDQFLGNFAVGRAGGNEL